MGGWGLTLANMAKGYADEDNARVLREQQRQRFDWEAQQAPALVKARNAANALVSAEADIGLSTAPQRTENARLKQANENIGLQADNAAADLTAQQRVNEATLGLRGSESALRSQPVEQAIAEMARIGQGEEQSRAFRGHLGHYVANKDYAGAMRLVNAVFNNPVVFPHTNGRKALGIDEVKKGAVLGKDARGKPIKADADGVFVRDSNGQGTLFTNESLGQAMQEKQKPGTFKAVQADNGNIVSFDTTSGKASTVIKGSGVSNGAAAKQGPLERDVSYLVNQHGMTKEQALAHLNQAKTMTREQFILKSVQDSIAMGVNPTTEIITNFGTLYDSARQAPVRTQSQPMNKADNWKNWEQ